MTKYKYIKRITYLFVLLSVLLFVLFIKKETAFAYQDYGNSWSICSHESWKFMSNGRFNIQFLGENASGGYTDNLGTSTVNVSGLSGKQYYYADFPGAIYFSIANQVNGLRLGSSSSGIFVYDMCSDCGSPYFQGFSVPFYYTAPTLYNGGVTSSNSNGVLTTNARTIYGNYRWPYRNYLYTNYQFQGASTLTNNYFVVNGTTVHDLGVQIRPMSGNEYNYGSKTLTIRLQRTSYELTIYPGVGTWNGRTGTVNSTVDPSLVQKWGTKKIIANPTANSYTVTLNANGGSGSTTRTAARPFSGWSQTGTGTLSGTTFTYGQGNKTLIANYSTNAITLPTLIRSGWTHMGWNTNQNATSAAYNNGSSYTPSGNTILYAIWKKDITITYDANGGTGAPSPETKTIYNSVSSASFTISNIVPARKGHTFLYWEKEDGSSRYYSGDSYTFTENTMLVAVWQDSFNVNATITRMLSPHEPVFKKGETGILIIHTTGYAEKVTVSFTSTLYPEGEYNREYMLNSSDELWDNESTFIIPLYCPEGEYMAEVTAYKGEQSIRVYPSLKVKGTVLDELRTRIRRN